MIDKQSDQKRLIRYNRTPSTREGITVRLRHRAESALYDPGVWKWALACDAPFSLSPVFRPLFLLRRPRRGVFFLMLLIILVSALSTDGEHFAREKCTAEQEPTATGMACRSRRPTLRCFFSRGSTDDRKRRRANNRIVLLAIRFVLRLFLPKHRACNI